MVKQGKKRVNTPRLKSVKGKLHQSITSIEDITNISKLIRNHIDSVIKEQEKHVKKLPFYFPVDKEPVYAEDHVNLNKTKFLIYHLALFGNISKTCQKIGIDRETYRNYMSLDEDFSKAVKSVRQQLKDMIEDELFIHCFVLHNPSVAIFASKCLLADRGWIEKRENINLTANVSSLQLEGLTQEELNNLADKTAEKIRKLKLNPVNDLITDADYTTLDDTGNLAQNDTSKAIDYDGE